MEDAEERATWHAFAGIQLSDSVCIRKTSKAMIPPLDPEDLGISYRKDRGGRVILLRLGF